MFKSESERIALVRTIAPLVWSFLLNRAADWQFDLDDVIADAVGLDVGIVNSATTVVVGVALWLLARFFPTVFERLLMWIPVSGYAYSRPDDSLVVAGGRVENAASVLDIEPDAVNRSDPFVRTFIDRQPSAVALRAAAQQLLEAADEAA